MHLAFRFALAVSATFVLSACSLHTNQAPAKAGASGSATAGSSGLNSGTQAGQNPGSPGGSDAASDTGEKAEGQGPGVGGSTTPGATEDCPAGQTLCGGRCVNLNFDRGNCGACADACSANRVVGGACLQGRCEGKCQAGFEDCNTDLRRDGCEVNLRRDLANCGGCNQACSGAQVRASRCVEGTCLGSCMPGFANCNGDLRGDGCEVDVRNDPNHCGACNQACGSGSKCQDGVCVSDCAPDEVDCDGSCVRLESNLSHCGACGDACSNEGMQSQACLAGSCTGSCATGRADCNEALRADGCETDVHGDPDNCGACGFACSRNNVRAALCTFGECKAWCEAGFDDCRRDQNDGCETAVHADPNNCGRCGFQCVARGNMREGAVCESGACRGQCQPGFMDCNSDPSDACEANVWGIENCGGCGIDCVDDLHYSEETATCNQPTPSSPHQCGGACQPKFGDCDADPANGCEADLRVDLANCGACGNVCAEGLRCENEQCVSPS